MPKSALSSAWSIVDLENSVNGRESPTRGFHGGDDGEPLTYDGSHTVILSRSEGCECSSGD